MTTISHDAFGRFEIVRRVDAYALHGAECAFCGASPRPKTEGQAKCRTLYNYGTSADDSGRTGWNERAFCGIGCFRSFNG